MILHLNINYTPLFVSSLNMYFFIWESNSLAMNHDNQNEEIQVFRFYILKANLPGHPILITI